ncbi:MAG: tail fiber domain-containing protein [Vicingaceae bacterium]|nr:tail fiber domain-containing protein [Vicingaceae bacterium]
MILKNILLKTLIYISSCIYFLVSDAYTQNIGINSNGAAPNVSALLDVDAAPSNDKGLLIPRIPLTATTNNAPIGAGIANSLLVFNTATVNDVYPGYYYWDGTKWVRLVDDAWQTLGNTGTNPATNFLGTIDNQDLVFRTNNLEQARITAAGLVGIGTNNPIYQLQVNGTGTIGALNLLGGVSMVRSIANDFAIVDASVYNANAFPAFIGLRGRGTFAAPAYPQTGDMMVQLSGRDVIDAYTASGQHGGGGLYVRATQNWTAGAKGGEIRFFSTPDNSANQLDQMVLSNVGNLGIGTLAPTSKLHVNNGVGQSFIRLTNGATNPFDIFYGPTFVGYNNAAGIVYYEVGGAETHMFGGEVIPDGDNLWSLGAATKRWSEVFAANGVINTSDKSQKKNIVALNYGIREVMNLKPVSFQWINGKLTNNQKLGFIAQDLIEILPEVVHKDEDESNPLGVYYSDIIPVLTKAIQEQQQMIENQEQKMKKQQQEIDLLKEILIKIENKQD